MALSRPAAAALVLSVLLLPGCGGGGEDPGPGPGSNQLTAAKANPSGDGQTGTVGQALPNPIRIVVLRGGTPASGEAVTWSTPAAGAALNPPSGSTDASGIASTVMTLGTAAGPQQAQAAVGGATGSPVVFTLNGTAGPATRLSAAGGNGQSANLNTPLANPLQVKVSDAFDNGVAGATVSWQVTSGAATVSSAASVSNSQGIASVTLNLGAAVGPVAVQATAAGLTGSPLAFNATSTAIVQLRTGGGNRFDPTSLTVPVGTTVTFRWVDGDHDVTSTGQPSFTSSGMPNLPPRDYQATFSAAGTYAYFCSVHGNPTSGMRGTITVTP